MYAIRSYYDPLPENLKNSLRVIFIYRTSLLVPELETARSTLAEVDK